MVSIPAAYTLNGRQQTVADGEGNLSTLGYDRLNRLALCNPGFRGHHTYCRLDAAAGVGGRAVRRR